LGGNNGGNNDNFEIINTVDFSQVNSDDNSNLSNFMNLLEADMKTINKDNGSYKNNSVA